MDKNLVRLLGAMGALAAAAPGASASPAAVAAAMTANSYADLLRPIPNAAAVLLAANAQPVDAEGAQRADARVDESAPDGSARVQEVQYHDHHHHHHHHHHRYHRRWHRHHHPIVVIRPPGQ